MEKYKLSQSELFLIVYGALYSGLTHNVYSCVTTLDIKNYLREVRNANITQEDVRLAMDELYNDSVEEENHIHINNLLYALRFKISQDGTHKEYYLENVSANEEFDEEDSEDIVKQFIIDNMDMSSYEIVKSLKSHYGDSLVIPSQASVAAIKANITRKK